ncbi:hypothetical protein RKF31_09070 [Klebsiella pneumoniae]|nr:hypothetical protein [Klebsiella pneumoniae]
MDQRWLDAFDNLGADLVTYFAADKTLVTGCSWLNPASGATYPGTLRGSGNEMIGESAKAPNLPAKAFIEE